MFVSLTPAIPVPGEEESCSAAETDEGAEKREGSYQYEDDEFEDEEEEEKEPDKEEDIGADSKGSAQERESRQDPEEEQQVKSTSEAAPKEESSLSPSSYDPHPASPAHSSSGGQRRTSVRDKGSSHSTESTRRRLSTGSSSAQTSRRSSKSSTSDGGSVGRKSSAGSVGSVGRHQAKREPSSPSPVQTTASISEALSAGTAENTAVTSTQSQIDTATETHTTADAPELSVTKERDKQDDKSDHTETTIDDQSTFKSTAGTTITADSISEELASQEEKSMSQTQTDDAGRKEDSDHLLQERPTGEESESGVTGDSADAATNELDTSVLESIADSTTAPGSVSEELVSQTETDAQQSRAHDTGKGDTSDHPLQEQPAQEGKQVGKEETMAESTETATGDQDISVLESTANTITVTESISEELTSQSSVPPSHVSTEMAPHTKQEAAIEDTDHAQEITPATGRKSPPTEQHTSKTGTPDHSSRHSSGRASRQPSRTSIREREEGPGSLGNSRRSSTIAVKEPIATASLPSTPVRRGSMSRRSSKSSIQESARAKPGSSPHRTASRRSSKSSNKGGEMDRLGSPHSSSPAHSNKSGSRRSSRHSVGEEAADRSRNAGRRASKSSVTSTSGHDIGRSRRSSKSSLSDLAQQKLGKSEGSTSIIDTTSKPGVEKDVPEEREAVQVEENGAIKQEVLESGNAALGNECQSDQHETLEKAVKKHSSSDPAVLEVGTSSLAEEPSQDTSVLPEGARHSHTPLQETGEIAKPVSKSPTDTKEVGSTASENAYVDNVIEQVLLKASESIVHGSAQPGTSSPIQEQATVVLQELVTAPTMAAADSSAGVNHAESEVSLQMAGEGSGNSSSMNPSKPPSPASGRQSRLSDRNREEEHVDHATSDSMPPPESSHTDRNSEEPPNGLPEEGDLSTEPKTASSEEYPTPCRDEKFTSPGHRQSRDGSQPGETAQSGSADQTPSQEEVLQSPKDDESASHETPHREEFHQNSSHTEQDGDHPGTADPTAGLEEQEQEGMEQGKVDSAAETPNTSATEEQRAEDKEKEASQYNSPPSAEHDKPTQEIIQTEDGHAEGDEERVSAAHPGEHPTADERESSPNDGESARGGAPFSQKPGEQLGEAKSGSSHSIQRKSSLTTATLAEASSEQASQKFQNTSASMEQLHETKDPAAAKTDSLQGSNTPVKPNSDGALRSNITHREVNEQSSTFAKNRRVHSI